MVRLRLRFDRFERLLLSPLYVPPVPQALAAKLTQRTVARTVRQVLRYLVTEYRETGTQVFGH